MEKASLPSSEAAVVHDKKLSLRTLSVANTVDSDTHSAGDRFSSTYHIYHKKELHHCISPTINESKERRFGPTIKEQRAKRRAKKKAPLREKENDVPSFEDLEVVADNDNDQGFFLQTPYLAFHDPPRVLRMGNSKHSDPVVLIHSFLFWWKWKLQFGPSLASPGVFDPRGVVCWKHNGGDKRALKADDRKLKGYKVRTWRLWGETGKRYVHSVKTARQTGAGADPDLREDNTSDKKEYEGASLMEKQIGLVCADETLYLEWASPFSKEPRRYSFHYAGINFCWKGTGTVKESRKFGFLVHFNHLKLVAKLPICDVIPDSEEKSKDGYEVCLGKYTCSIAARKNGTLQLFDGAILRLMEEYMPSKLPRLDGEKYERLLEDEAKEKLDDTHNMRIEAVKRTSLYHVIVATARCMIIGEKQKRETIRKIIETAASEGGGGAAA